MNIKNQLKFHGTYNHSIVLLINSYLEIMPQIFKSIIHDHHNISLLKRTIWKIMQWFTIEFMKWKFMFNKLLWFFEDQWYCMHVSWCMCIVNDLWCKLKVLMVLGWGCYKYAQDIHARSGQTMNSLILRNWNCVL